MMFLEGTLNAVDAYGHVSPERCGIEGGQWRVERAMAIRCL